MRLYRFAAALLSLALLGGCAGYDIRYDFDASAPYARYKTFDWYTAKKGTGGTTSLMDKRVRAAVQAELQTKGFKLDAQGDPDFLVTYYPVVQDKKVRTTTTRVGVGTGWGAKPLNARVGLSTSQVRHFKEGTIVVEIVDFRSNQLVWQGSATGALTALKNPEEANEVIPKAVRDILAKFPPN